MSSGFIDIQVNGYSGVDFSSSELTAGAIDAAVGQLHALGTTAFFPTVVTVAPKVYDHVLPLLADAMDRHPGRIPGIHIEGPFISPEDGAVGAHPRQYVADPSIEAFDRLSELARGRIRLVTLAPERPGALDLIAHLRESGVAVALGHTLTDADTVMESVAAGVRLSTHLGNGCPQMMHRHENPVIAQLGSPLAAAIIPDGHHIPPAFIRAVAAAKGPRRLVAVSDCVALAGMPPGEYALFGTRVRKEESGRLSNLQAPGLAGSSATMLECMNHLARVTGWSEAELWAAGRDNVLELLGITPDAVDCSGPVVWRDGVFATGEHL